MFWLIHLPTADPRINYDRNMMLRSHFLKYYCLYNPVFRICYRFRFDVFLTLVLVAAKVRYMYLLLVLSIPTYLPKVSTCTTLVIYLRQKE